ncbi:cora-domain-containing protein [Lojkania enalia]|uniref:Magnesium transporter n=1 Tax=Lojkania enalia TaxID=147567 RepID=A0A9P4K6X9_9PLEO|nr:cora-domain-containing protein [Didymosphaeria enalia]
MKPIPLHNFAIPSPSVLRFLRAQVKNAFEEPASRGAALRCQRSRFASTCVKEEKTSGGVMAPGGAVVKQIVWKENRSFLLARITGLNSKLGTSTSYSSPSCTISLQCRRTFSKTSRQDAWNLLGRKKRQRVNPSPSVPTSPLAMTMDGGIGFNGLGRIARPANELKMRCTELDENGNVTMVSGEFKKSELIAKYGLLPRDLRKIDSSLLPHILVRPSAILINLLHLRVLIKHNRVLVFDAYGTTDSKSQSVFMYDLDLKLRQKQSVANDTLPYEFRALEAVLISVTLGLEKEFEGVSEPVVKVLMELEEDIDRDKLRHLLIYSKKLGSFEQKARLVRDSLSELLDADDDLSAMYLSEKAEGKTREEHDHTEVEMLLESYHKVADEIVQAAENLVSSIRNTEEIVKAILDANRNSLMLLDLKFSILTLSITAGTFVAALYGMNLKNFLEESDIGFFGISAWCSVFGLIVAAYGLTKLRKVQRVSMWGHGGSRSVYP